MRLLDRYLLRELLVPLAYCLSGFLMLWIAFDLFAELDKLQSQKLSAFDVFNYYVFQVPEMLPIVLPVALLLAVLYALSQHARAHEITAMRAAGISLWRLALPYWAVGFIFSLLLLVSNELLAPLGLERAERLLHRHDQPAEEKQHWKPDFHFRNEMEQRVWDAKFYNLKTHMLTNLHVRWHFPNGSWRDIYADSGVWSNGAWHLVNVQEWLYQAPNDPFPVPTLRPQAAFPFSETPALIKSEIKINGLSLRVAAKRPRLSLQEIRNYLHFHPQIPPAQSALLKTQWHGRIALPWRCLIVVLIALPFSAPSGRRNVFAGVATSIFLCFAYFIFFQMGLHLGVSGLCPGWLAGWLPNLLFGATGLVLTARVR